MNLLLASISPTAFAAVLHVAAAASLGMIALWIVQAVRRNATIVDVAWAAALFGAALYLGAVGAGHPWRRAIVAGVGGVWAARLTWHLFSDRVRRRWDEEDGRYARMRAAMGRQAQVGFFVFFQVQALFVVCFAIPLAAAAWNPAPFGGLDILGLVVGACAIGGERLADRQLAAFRRDPANAGRTCDLGLWRYSRHPNYFCEFLHWFAYVLLAVGYGGWWFSLGGPVAMYLLIMYVTGVPHTEQQALSHRPDYAAYQRRTNRFFPWKPRNDHELD